jgi:hypothetical protein
MKKMNSMQTSCVCVCACTCFCVCVCFKVGDRVEVRDGAEEWEQGTVSEVVEDSKASSGTAAASEDVQRVRVVKDGYASG